MAEAGLLFKNQVKLLAQTFFIKDNKKELLLCAHKYDFDIHFFDQMSDFVTAVENASDQDLFVIDLDVLYNMQNDMQQQRRQTMFLSDLLQRLPAHHNYVYLQTVRQGERFYYNKSWLKVIAWPTLKNQSAMKCWLINYSIFLAATNAAKPM
jgi:hypothetical protein